MIVLSSSSAVFWTHFEVFCRRYDSFIFFVFRTEKKHGHCPVWAGLSTPSAAVFSKTVKMGFFCCGYITDSVGVTLVPVPWGLCAKKPLQRSKWARAQQRPRSTNGRAKKILLSTHHPLFSNLNLATAIQHANHDSSHAASSTGIAPNNSPRL